ncbi:MAG: ATP-binding protein [Planctomycetia bacterium]|nr:ATP-binding protein [Planctomycetia bacterium]
MLVEFRVENHRSLRDEQVLTMQAGRVGDETDPRPRHVPGHADSLLTVAGLYGANASGKSNVLAALAFMREAVVMSHRFWSPDVGASRESSVPREPFAWGPKRNESSLFEVTFLVGHVRYQYGFQASDERFLEEWLYAWPSGKKQVWFERDNQTLKFGENLKGENRVIAEVTRPNALFLSTAVQHQHPQVAPVFAWFADLQVINLPVRQYSSMPFQMSSELVLATLLEDEAYRHASSLIPSLPDEDLPKPLLEDFRHWLKQADIGIVDVRAEKREQEGKRRRLGPAFFLKHESAADDAWLPLREESHGTQTLFHMAFPILRVLRIGGVLLVDELERSLHPALARKIIEQFNDPATNPKNGQIVFATHDTNLLGTTVGEPALRRDQVWLTEKDPEGATVLYPLTDYKPRKAENLERGYLQGRYGAIPFLGDFLVTGK